MHRRRADTNSNTDTNADAADVRADTNTATRADAADVRADTIVTPRTVNTRIGKLRTVETVIG